MGVNRRGDAGLEPTGLPVKTSAVEVLGDAFVAVARRPDLIVPLIALDGVVAVIAMTNSSALTTPLGGEEAWPRITAGLAAGLFAPSLLPFGGLGVTWADAWSNLPGVGLVNGLWQITLIILAAVAGVIFLSRLAVADAPSTGFAPRRAAFPRLVKRCAALGLLLLALPLFVGGPLLIGGWALNGVEASRWPLMSAAIGLCVAAFFVLRFSFDALIVDQVSPLDAINRSWWVVTRRPGGALRLLLLSLCIAAGTRTLWLSMVDIPAGLMLGMVGNAWIATSLALARMNFYRVIRAGVPVRQGPALTAVD